MPLVASSRYFYDPPEVTAIAAFPDATARHWGYFRDVPSDAPIAVVESDDRRGTPGGGYHSRLLPCIAGQTDGHLARFCGERV